MESVGWIIPFKGFNQSGTYNQNFLWKKGSLYIMDNHRAAMWCWFQHIDIERKYNLFHIDKHTDTLYSNIEIWKKHLPDMTEVSIEEYLTFKHTEEFELIRWDNYLSLFLECYPKLIDVCYFATHNEGDTPRFHNCRQADIWHIPTNIDYWIYDSKVEWIFNIDIDYFVAVDEKSSVELFSDQFIERMFEPVAKSYYDGKISVITISLSPECSGGWEESLKICKKICNVFDIDFSIDS
jgi:hypothetical protein